MAAENKGFGALFSEKKNQLDHLQQRMANVIPAMPGMPVAKYFDLAVGIDFHPTIWPPSPLFPVPHIGMVFDIMGAIMATLAAVLPEPDNDPNAPTTITSVAVAVVNAMKPTVKVHGQWIANAGTGIQHLPGLTLHVLPGVLPMATSEMWMGSSSVLADGGPCSTQFHPALSCNLVGIPSLFRMNKAPRPKVALMAPTSVLLCITSAGAPVLVGGPPTIDLFQLMFKLALKGLGKAWKKATSKFKELLEHVKAKNPKLAAILKSINCHLFGEPVDAATGRVYHNSTDFSLPGPIPLVWERTYYSDAEVAGPLGYNWHHSYNLGLYDMGNGYFTLRLADGRETVLPELGIGELHYNRREQLLWQKDEAGYYLTDTDKLIYRFNGPQNREGYRTLSAIANKQGFTILFRYNRHGDLQQIIDSSNRIVAVENDALGRITRIYTCCKKEEINLIRYAYDTPGNMVQTTDALGSSKHFYYEDHLLVKLTSQSGFSFYWEYEGNGDDARCIHTWGDGGVLEYWTQYEEGKTTTHNSLGHTTEYYYHPDKLIYKIIDANGGITHQQYNNYEELAVVTNPEGLSVQYKHNAWGKLTQRINENEEAVKYTYDDRLNLTGITSPGGRSKRWQYDELDRIIQITNTDGNSLQYHYDGRLLTRITDSRKRSFCLEYDSQYNVIKFGYPNDRWQSWAYDELGRTTSATGTNNQLTRYRYNNKGNMVWIGEANGNEHYFEYDAADNLIHAKDESHQVEFGYGPLGSLRTRTQNGSTVAFGYDTELQLRSIANEGGEVYRFGLDAVGQVVNEWGFDGLHRNYIRDGAGRVKRVVRPNGRWSSYEYDGTGHVVKEDHYDGSGAAYRYNSDGLLMEAFNADGHLKLLRDKGGRITKEQQGKYEVTKKYDSFGNCIFTGSSLGAAIENIHSEEGHLQQMTAGNWRAAWQRDEDGLELQRSLSGGVEVLTERDTHGRVSRRSIGASNIEQSRTRYLWDKSYRLQRMINELSGAKVNFEYDAFDNLISAEYRESSGAETIYRIPDKIGNLFKTRERSDRKYSAGGRLTEDPQFYFHYDGEGNLIFKEYKTNGSHTAKERQGYATENGIKLRGSGTGWLYGWSGNGMLQQVVSPNNIVTTFNYDPLGRRIAKQHRGQVTRWLWDGNTPLHQWCYKGAFPPQTMVNEQGELKHAEEPVENTITWVHEEGSFVPCARIEDGEQYSIVADYLGTPTHAFDSKGAKVWERELDCYGAVRKETGIKGLVPQLYQGQMLDEEIGLAYNRFRYYALKEGVYISQDPLKMQGGGKLYSYVGNPTICVDIFGLLTIYHGTTKGGATNIKQNGIDLSKNRPNLDFNSSGTGALYTSPSYEETLKYNRRLEKIGRGSTDIVTLDIPDDKLTDLKIKTFDGATEEWADFVTQARSGTLVHDYDMVIGPKLANPQQVLQGLESPKALKEIQITFNSQKAADLASQHIHH